MNGRTQGAMGQMWVNGSPVVVSNVTIENVRATDGGFSGFLPGGSHEVTIKCSSGGWDGLRDIMKRAELRDMRRGRMARMARRAKRAMA